MSETKIKLIVNADDFGLHESINEAIEIAHKNGILTSASLAVNGESFEQAVHIAKTNKNLGIGMHLTLNGEKPISPPEKISSIVDSNGKFFESHGELCKKILLKKVSLRDIAIECKAQIEKFFQAGLVPTHIDSHRHVHLFFPIFKVLDPILKKFNLNKIRWVNIPLFDYRKISFQKISYVFLSQYTRLLMGTVYKYPDYFVGFFRSGSININYLKNILAKLKSKTTEINFHPGRDNNLIGRKYGFWKKRHSWECDWEREYKLLLNSDIKKILSARNISLVNYSHL